MDTEDREDLETTEAAPEAAESEATEPAKAAKKPEIPGADLEVDIVLEETAPKSASSEDDEFGDYAKEYGYEETEAKAEGEEVAAEDDDESEALVEPIKDVKIELSKGAQYRGTGKRKSSVARVIITPGNGKITVNGRNVEEYFPRAALTMRLIEPLKIVGYEDKLNVTVNIHGGGVSSQASAVRHGIARALIEAQPNLRSQLKVRGFLTRDARVKERKKAGLKKARKRPQFSKR